MLSNSTGTQTLVCRSNNVREARDMDCNEVKEHLSAYHDDELASDIRMVVAAHLAGCDVCSQELAGFGELSAIAR